ncbi:MAG: hypothetical protein ACK56I_04180, partial [bacterium]
FNEFNVERLRRYLRRPLALGGDADEPPPVVAQGDSLEHEVAAIMPTVPLARGMPAGAGPLGWPRRFWRELGTAGELRLTNCEEAIAAFERSRGVKLSRRPSGGGGGCGSSPAAPYRLHCGPCAW